MHAVAVMGEDGIGGRASLGQTTVSVRTSIVPPGPRPPSADTPGTSPLITTPQVTPSLHDFAGSLSPCRQGRPARTAGLTRSAARQLLETLRLMRGVDYARRLIRPVRPAPWRVPLRAPRLEDARSSGDLGQFDAWMQTGYPDYRMRQRSSYLKRTRGSLRHLGRDREERIAGVLRLRALDAVAPAAREGDPLPLLRVPLLIEDRDAVALELRRLGINVFFVYAPPLDDYAGPELCEPSPLPEAARWWAAHILPVDPHDADRLLGLVAKKQVRLTPALPPRLSRDGSPLGSF